MPTPPKKFDDFGAGSFEDELDVDMWGAGPDLPDDEPMPEELEDPCPDCGAPMGEEHDPSCPNAEPPEGVDPDTAWDTRFEAQDRGDVQTEPGAGDHPSDCTCKSCEEVQAEAFGFGRFMNRIISEETKKGMPVLNDSPHRKRALREQERPLGRTRIGGK